MISTDYYDILLQGIDSRCTVSRLVHGVSWTAAVLGKRVGMIGHMIGHSNITAELLAPAAKLWIMDREEKPGAYPDSAAEFFLPDCDVVIITGSAAINKTLPRLLELSRRAQVILTGPSVSCCPVRPASPRRWRVPSSSSRNFGSRKPCAE